MYTPQSRGAQQAVQRPADICIVVDDTNQVGRLNWISHDVLLIVLGFRLGQDFLSFSSNASGSSGFSKKAAAPSWAEALRAAVAGNAVMTTTGKTPAHPVELPLQPQAVKARHVQIGHKAVGGRAAGRREANSCAEPERS